MNWLMDRQQQMTDAGIEPCVTYTRDRPVGSDQLRKCLWVSGARQCSAPIQQRCA